MLEAAEQWLESHVALQRCAQFQRVARQRVRDYLAPRLGSRQLTALTREDVRSYRRSLEATTALGSSSVRAVLGDLRCMLNWAVDAGWIEQSPFPSNVMPAEQELPPRRLNDQEIALVIATPDPYGFVCRFAIGTGLRWSEMRRVRMDDIEDGVLTVHRTKSGKLRRVPLPPALAAELAAKGDPLVTLRWNESFNRTVRRLSGVRRFSAHRLRHTYATKWLEAGGSLGALQQVLGHASITHTMRYAHVSADLVRRESKRIFDEMFNGVPSRRD